MRRLAFSLPLALLFCVLYSLDAGATVVKVRPDQFRPVTSGDSYYATPEHSGGPIVVTKTIALPVGKTIRRLIHFSSNGFEGRTIVRLYRVKFGGSCQEMARTVSDTENYPDIEKASSAAIAYPVIEAGYTYYLTVLIQNNNTLFYGAEITYQ